MGPVVNQDIIINNQVVTRVTETRFLGVIIDEHLDYHKHITHIKSKVAKGVGILCRAKKFLNIKTLQDLYYSFVHPYLNYCIEIWGSTHTTYLESLVLLQKRAVRVIVGAARLAHTDGIFKMLNILPLRKLHTYNIHLFLHKVVNHITPTVISDMFTYNSDIHSYFTRQSSQFHVYKVLSEPRKRSIRHQAIIIYNCNEDSTVYQLLYVAYKKHIKTFLLEL